MKVRKLQVYDDSALIIFHTEGQWRTRDSKLIPYHEFLEELIKEFEEISLEYLPRSQNQFADVLATLSSMLQVIDGLDIEPLKIEILRRLAYCSAIADEPDEKPWYYDIMNYLQKGEYPHGSELANQKYIRKLASKFFISSNALYKRSFDSILLKCVDARKANQLMREIHEGECGPNMNGYLLAKKIMRLGYFWMAMEADWATPFSLVYGMEAILAIEVEIPSLRILSQVELSEEEWIQQRCDQLNMINEKRLKALCHG
ncbi:uncharacterized protein LOC130140444 [Syzygium oleosum]|uniref:uncharacterized protein LOC130140444 n=1 Tax=Syzygium oleosum TaxID=219896 RepID=UPI0024BB9A06|nr:uncharacterized protein LOC130140444 [Syzygium oleosum]